MQYYKVSNQYLFKILILGLVINCSISAKEHSTLAYYPVKKGDTFWSITKRLTKKPWEWQNIWELNKHKFASPKSIKPGDHIILEEKNGYPILQIKQSANQQKYYPRVDYNFKVGTKRHIGHAGILYPLLQNSNSLFYTNIIGMLDSENSQEGNFGLGYRMLQNNSIFGFYTFYDRRATMYDNVINQVTLGAEFLKERFELRTNIYIPKIREKLIKETPCLCGAYPYYSNTVIKEEKDTYIEVPMHGFDIEIGGTIPKFKKLNSFVTFYYFNGGGVSSISGLRIRASALLHRFFSLESEVSYDNHRKLQGFLGVKCSIQFGRNKNKKQGFLINKMTQFPVRDIDVMVRQKHKRVSTLRLEEGNVLVTAASGSSVKLEGDYAKTNMEEIDDLTGSGGVKEILVWDIHGKLRPLYEVSEQVLAETKATRYSRKDFTDDSKTGEGLQRKVDTANLVEQIAFEMVPLAPPPPLAVTKKQTMEEQLLEQWKTKYDPEKRKALGKLMQNKTILDKVEKLYGREYERAKVRAQAGNLFAEMSRKAKELEERNDEVMKKLGKKEQEIEKGQKIEQIKSHKQALASLCAEFQAKREERVENGTWRFRAHPAENKKRKDDAGNTQLGDGMSTPQKQRSNRGKYGSAAADVFGTPLTPGRLTQPIFGTPVAQQPVFGTPKTPAAQQPVFGTPKTPAAQQLEFGTPATTPQRQVFGTPVTTPQTSAFGTPATPLNMEPGSLKLLELTHGKSSEQIKAMRRAFKEEGEESLSRLATPNSARSISKKGHRFKLPTGDDFRKAVLLSELGSESMEEIGFFTPRSQPPQLRKTRKHSF